MDPQSLKSLKTLQYKEGRKIRYHTDFKSTGQLSKIIDHLKTGTSPNVAGITVISVFSSPANGTIKRTMTCPLPQTATVQAIMGSEPVHVEYDIAYNDSMLVIKAVNPKDINKFFKFTEELTISQENDELLFSRDAHIFNAGKQIPLFGGSYQEYDDYFNHNTLSFYLELARIAK